MATGAGPRSAICPASPVTSRGSRRCVESRARATIAANYGGRWDLMQALLKLMRSAPLPTEGFTEEQLAPHLALNYAPEPDLFIRTGGEQRISNFLLWQLAYTELYFTPTL